MGLSTSPASESLGAPACTSADLFSRRRDRLFSLLWALTIALSLLASAIAGALILDPAWMDELWPVQTELEQLEFDTLLLAFTAVGVVLGLLALSAYLTSYDIFRGYRPYVRLYTLLAAVLIYPATITVAWFPSEVLTWALSLGMVLLGPAFFLGLEQLIGAGLISLGAMLFQRNLWAFSALLLGQGLRMYATSRTARRNHGMVLLSLGRLSEARALLEPLFAEGMRDERLARALFELALANEEWDTALERLKALRAARPDDGGLLFQHALILKNRGQWDQAAAILSERPLATLDGESLRLLEECCRLSGDVQGALAVVEYLARPMKYQEALGLYRPLIDADDADPRVARSLAALARDRNHPDDEGRWVERVVAAEPDNEEARRRLVALYNQMQRPDLELGHLEALISRGGRDPDLLVRYSRLLYDMGRYEEGLAIMERNAGQFPDDGRFPLAMARHCLRLGALEQARTCATRATQIVERPADSGDGSSVGDDSLVRETRVLARQIETAMQRRELDESRSAALAEPGNMNARVRYIRLLAVNDEIEECVREMDEVVSRHPELKPRIQKEALEFTDLVARPFLIYSYLSDLALQDRDFDKALELYQTMASRSMHPEEIVGEGCKWILTMEPDHLQAQAMLGIFHASRQEYAEALEVLTAYYRAGGPPAVLVDRAMFLSLSQTGRPDEATPYLERVLQEAPDQIDLLRIQADQFEAAGKDRLALDCLRRLRKERVKELELYDRIQALENRIRENRYFELLEILKEHPGDPALNMEMGDLYFHRGEHLKAVKHFQKAERQSDWRHLCAAKQAFCLAKRFLYDLAEEHLDRVNLEEVSPEQAWEIKSLLYGIGTLYEKQEARDKAMGVYKRIFRVDAGFRDVAQKMEHLFE